MARPSQIEERRREYLPVLARAFAELGYRRTTTAALAARLKVRENILYRIWPDKKAMFLAAIDYVHDRSISQWQQVLDAADDDGRSPATHLLHHEAKHHGEAGLYRIILAGLSETDDPQIHAALKQLFLRFHRFITRQVRDHRGAAGQGESAHTRRAWALVGLAMFADIGRELSLFSPASRRKLIREMGQLLLEGEGIGR